MAVLIWQKLPLLTVAATFHIFSVFLWFLLELMAIGDFYPDYNCLHNAISDLGIPYDFEDSKHSYRLSRSQKSTIMNTNFRLVAVFYAVAQSALLYGLTQEVPMVRSKSWRHVREIRVVLSLLFMLGLSTVGTVHAGPREDSNGEKIVHLAGAALAISSGNVNSVLCGTLSDPIKTTRSKYYQSISFALGSIGLFAGVCTKVASSYGFSGATERISVYCILAWGFVTGVVILGKPIRPEDGKGGKDI